MNTEHASVKAARIENIAKARTLGVKFPNGFDAISQEDLGGALVNESEYYGNSFDVATHEEWVAIARRCAADEQREFDIDADLDCLTEFDEWLDRKIAEHS